MMTSLIAGTGGKTEMNSANSPEGHHKVLIVGGGSAGLTLAARLRGMLKSRA